MTSKLKWGLAGLLVYIVFLVAYLPATTALSFVKLPPNIQVYGVSGTLWHGKAEQLVVNQLPVQGVEWELGFFPLLIGNASVDISAGNQRASEEIAFSGHVSISLTNPQAISAEDAQAFLPTSLLVSQLALPLPVNAGGRIRVFLSTLDYDGGCETLIGNGSWLNASVAGTQGPIGLGTFNADLACQAPNITVDVQPNNSLGLDVLATVTPQMGISVDGQFKPDADLPAEVHQAAKFFGQANADGVYPVKF